jgi:hypothetical protein
MNGYSSGSSASHAVDTESRNSVRPTSGPGAFAGFVTFWPAASRMWCTSAEVAVNQPLSGTPSARTCRPMPSKIRGVTDPQGLRESCVACRQRGHTGRNTGVEDDPPLLVQRVGEQFLNVSVPRTVT